VQCCPSVAARNAGLGLSAVNIQTETIQSNSQYDSSMLQGNNATAAPGGGLEVSWSLPRQEFYPIPADAFLQNGDYACDPPSPRAQVPDAGLLLMTARAVMCGGV